MGLSMQRGTLTMRTTLTTPATPRLAAVKALQTGTPMRPRGRTATRAATAKTEERKGLCTRRRMEDCMREKWRAFMRMRR